MATTKKAAGAPADLRAHILNCEDRKAEKVHIPQWGVDVWVGVMSVGDRDRFDLNVFLSEDASMRAWLVAMTALDAEGNRIFSDEDVPALVKKSGAATDPIYVKAVRLNGLEAGAQEEAAKN
ncbi:hypothetical protein [Euryhalocaulis caribicus]|uniref:hypothetical protein n=1 Tax=Euryhalocaulis caribicus TaxID=1161401 RepID=UPI0003A21820|nr:hypothetical protein [Euryhalocaulis caribicus]